DRRLHHASQRSLQPSRRPGFRRHHAGVRHPPKQQRSKHHEHGVQLAHLQRKIRPRHHSPNRATWRTRPHPPHQSRNGPPSDPPSRSSVRRHRHGRRPPARI